MVQAKFAAYGGALLLLWLLRPRAPRVAIGDVDLGVGTIDGVYGGDYSIPRPSGNPSTNPATNPEMRRLIDESNAAIAAANGD